MLCIQLKRKFICLQINPIEVESFKSFLFYCMYLFLAVLGLHCCAYAFSSCGRQGLLFTVVCRLLIVVASLVAKTVLGHVGFSSCSTWAQQLWLMGLVALQPVGSSHTRDRTHVFCTDRWILNHCTTSKVQCLPVLINKQLLADNFLHKHMWTHYTCYLISS